MIESFNNVIKRKAKPKAEFPTEQSLDALPRPGKWNMQQGTDIYMFIRRTVSS